MELHKDEEIYVLVGQMGEHACIKSMGNERNEPCSSRLPKHPENVKDSVSIINKFRNDLLENGAGGGGGASFVFLVGILFSQDLFIASTNDEYFFIPFYLRSCR